ncbi:hypothetical protein [Pseudoalteromonas luteoviolacea]|uniref:Membrane protein n=1 Tax=Pseudoalteromonas luteoviolacea S4060-1 TaxID=1365257 RepID=A0A167LPJ7_9GAMM|nr:hypothetical protein [Pseudoalteromonas luteoviolacea]KZN64978.1 membrane protein [Pseudoalteromonas luteoviolacea S4060-1]
MSNKTFLTIHGGIYLVFALALFFLPTLVWPMYGVEINDKYSYFLSQHTSIFLGGLGATSLLFRRVQAAEAVQQLLKSLIITNLLGVIITSYAGVTGVFVGFGWSDPAFFAVLTVLSFSQLKKYSN